jgi:hypothetical protein
MTMAGRRNAQFRAHAFHRALLFFRVDDAAHYLAGQLAVDDFQFVRVGEVEAQALLQALGEEGEAARHQQRLQAGLCTAASMASAPGDSCRRSS